MINKKVLQRFRVPVGEKVRLKDYFTDWDQIPELKNLEKNAVKERSEELLKQNQIDLATAQESLYADDRHALLIIFQAMDAAGKDGTIKHVMSGVNPQGCQVFSFKKPSAEEMDHNFLWRYMRSLPERGRIGIFNRSYYEDVLIVKVHPEILASQRLPDRKFGRKFWLRRYDDINAFEHHLVRSGTTVLKFFLNVSRDEQKRRFLERLENPEKHWKFSAADIHERAFWDSYMSAYEDALSATSTKWAPWYVVPADQKWATRAVVADVITSTLHKLNLQLPVISDAAREQMAAARMELLAESPTQTP